MISRCKSCGGSLSTEFKDFDLCSFVTSDCRIWKNLPNLAVCDGCLLLQRIPTTLWKADCKRIYSNYVPYRKGLEQKKYNAKNSNLETRSSILLERFKTINPGCAPHAWLDFGCGDGQLLKTVKNAFPSSQLFGIDQTDTFREYIENEIQATYLYRLYDFQGCFDVVSMVHVLEHLVDPLEVLKEIKTSLTSTGKLFIQVPSYQKNPFDLLIYDHASFFSQESLQHLLGRVGFRVVEMNEDWVSKEISAVCTVDENKKSLEYVCDSIFDIKKIVVGHERYLTSIVAEAHNKLRESNKVKIFGSSIGACWLAAEIGIDSVLCFLDEDINRCGEELFGVPIRKPIKEDYQDAVIPLDLQTKAKVLRRIYGS